MVALDTGPSAESDSRFATRRQRPQPTLLLAARTSKPAEHYRRHG